MATLLAKRFDLPKESVDKLKVAIMLYDNTTVNEENGRTVFKDFFRQEQMHKVFEMFILNFYATHLERPKYKVHAPKINWHLEDDENV